MADPKDAERLAYIRGYYKNISEAPDSLNDVVGHAAFLLRLLNNCDTTIARLTEERDISKQAHLETMARLPCVKCCGNGGCDHTFPQRIQLWQQTVAELTQERDSLNNQNRSLAIECDKWIRSSRQYKQERDEARLRAG